MKIVAAEYVKSCLKPEEFPREGFGEVAFVGRSNVGKSSLINSLLHRKGLAKVSATPGKTRIINFFLVTTTDPDMKRLYVVDLPGYGYAKVARSVRAQWGPMIEGYLRARKALRGAILLVDARGAERSDSTTFAWLSELGVPVVIAATKADKLARSERRAGMEMIRAALTVPGDVPVILYSSVTHEGRDELWRAIRTLLKGRD
jgi:GTP-binding protein